MPTKAEYRLNKPKRRDTPTKVKPHIFTKSDIVNKVGLDAMVSANPENIHFESNK